MLVELAVRDLGVIESARITLPEGATALTGETGAGKTMLVEAISLLCGARADPQCVRPGSDESVVEALFVVRAGGASADEELVLRRVVPVDGRSRAYINDSLVPAGRLAEVALDLVEIHGQHSQQGLLSAGAQRAVLDRYARIDTTGLDLAQSDVRRLRREVDDLGGDAEVRRRELELLRHEVAEIEAAGVVEGEDQRLEEEEDLLDGAVEHRAAADRTLASLSDDAGILDQLARAEVDLGSRSPLASTAERLTQLRIELDEVSADLRRQAEAIEVDDVRLDAVRLRRAQLSGLRRRYGSDEAAIIDHARRCHERIVEIEAATARASVVSAELQSASDRLDAEAHAVGSRRRAAADTLAEELAEQLQRLALPSAQVVIAVSDDSALPGAGSHVEVRIATNPGMDPAPLAKVASGGELSRVMLALRLIGSGGPPTMIFDEVDAGIGGAAANAVADALRAVAEDHQVLLVTHLAQIAAVADEHILVVKNADDHRTTTEVHPLDQDQRIVEIARMLSGDSDSSVARQHAEELLVGRLTSPRDSSR
ncbi:MAG: DNA repair protein RecN [Actinobacteria bacterium]|nr:DNA repair protein RecN [Actinomycetota bacterium]